MCKIVTINRIRSWNSDKKMYLLGVTSSVNALYMMGEVMEKKSGFVPTLELSCLLCLILYSLFNKNKYNKNVLLIN